jgi:hypothetical protein
MHSRFLLPIPLLILTFLFCLYTFCDGPSTKLVNPIKIIMTTEPHKPSEEEKQEESLFQTPSPQQQQEEVVSPDAVVEVVTHDVEANQDVQNDEDNQKVEKDDDNNNKSYNNNDEEEKEDTEQTKKKTHMKVAADAPWVDRMWEVRSIQYASSVCFAYSLGLCMAIVLINNLIYQFFSLSSSPPCYYGVCYIIGRDNIFATWICGLWWPPSSYCYPP